MNIPTQAVEARLQRSLQPFASILVRIGGHPAQSLQTVPKFGEPIAQASHLAQLGAQKAVSASRMPTLRIFRMKGGGREGVQFSSKMLQHIGAAIDSFLANLGKDL